MTWTDHSFIVKENVNLKPRKCAIFCNPQHFGGLFLSQEWISSRALQNVLQYGIGKIVNQMDENNEHILYMCGKIMSALHLQLLNR